MTESRERKVQFTFSRVQGIDERFQPAVHEAMREYMEKLETADPFSLDAPGMDYTASNGVRIEVKALDITEGALAEKSSPWLHEMSDEEIALYCGPDLTNHEDNQ